jgi:hypothetical protein
MRKRPGVAPSPGVVEPSDEVLSDPERNFLNMEIPPSKMERGGRMRPAFTSLDDWGFQ